LAPFETGLQLPDSASAQFIALQHYLRFLFHWSLALDLVLIERFLAQFDAQLSDFPNNFVAKKDTSK